MKAAEVVDMFRHYRHDLLNDIQLIHGYASMGNLDKIKDKLQDLLQKTNEERRLTNLKCPHFTLWLMNFNAQYENIRLSYKVLIQEDLSTFDLTLYATCQEIIQILHNYSSKEKLYNGELILFNEGEPKVKLTFDGAFRNLEECRQKLKKQEYVETIEVKEEKLSVLFAF